MSTYTRNAVLVAGIAIFTVMVSGCGDDPAAPDAGPADFSGIFIDSTVSGLGYSTPTHNGTTDATGTFLYRADEVVTFSIGGIDLGSASASPAMSPRDIGPDAAASTNIARFLQTIDDDGDLDNGIQITGAVTAAADAMTVDFAQSTDAFGADGNVATTVQTLTGVTTEGTRTLITAQDADEHLDASLSEGFPSSSTGRWFVTFPGVTTDMVLFTLNSGGSGQFNEAVNGFVDADESMTWEIVNGELYVDYIDEEVDRFTVVSGNEVTYEVRITTTAAEGTDQQMGIMTREQSWATAGVEGSYQTSFDGEPLTITLETGGQGTYTWTDGTDPITWVLTEQGSLMITPDPAFQDELILLGSDGSQRDVLFITNDVDPPNTEEWERISMTAP